MEVLPSRWTGEEVAGCHGEQGGPQQLLVALPAQVQAVGQEAQEVSFVEVLLERFGVCGKRFL